MPSTTTTINASELRTASRISEIAEDGQPVIVTVLKRPTAFIMKLPTNDAEAKEILSRLVSAAIDSGCYWGN